jgi:hypothetical protein
MCQPAEWSSSIKNSTPKAANKIDATATSLVMKLKAARAFTRAVIDRYRNAGLTSISHDFYPGGRHQMPHETNRHDVITNFLVWISGIF